MSLRELISKILEKNIALFENEYSNALKYVFTDVLASSKGMITSELVNEELEKIQKKNNCRTSKLHRTRNSMRSFVNELVILFKLNFFSKNH